MWVYSLGVFILLSCEAAAKSDVCPDPDAKDGHLEFNVADLQNDPEKIKRCLREHLNTRIKTGELVGDINIHTSIEPINENNADEHATDVTTLSITAPLGSEVPSSTTVLSSPTQTHQTETVTANPSSNALFSSPTLTKTTKNTAQDAATMVDIALEYGITSCPPYCGNANETSYKWCVLETMCNCNRKILELHQNETKKNAHSCMIPVADNCTAICNAAQANGSKIIPSQSNEFSPNGTFAAIIIIDGVQKQVHCSCMNETRHGIPRTNGWVIIQRHIHEDANFSRSWSEYKDGFSDGESVWIGLATLHNLTRNGASMQIELGKRENKTMKFHYIKYRRFYVSFPKLDYSLAVELDSSNESSAIDYLDPENTIPIFSVDETSGWWLTDNLTNLNGKSGILWGNVTYNISRMLVLPRPDIIEENCTYAMCPEIPATATGLKFCIKTSCKCDRSWLTVNKSNGKFKPDWHKTCKVPFGDNCTEVCQIWTNVTAPNSPTKMPARIKICGRYKKVYCNCSDKDPGWLVIWHKKSNNTFALGNCNETFDDYGRSGDYWIGFNSIGRLLEQYNASLQVTVRSRNLNSSEREKYHIIKYQLFFKSGAKFIGENPSAVDSSESVPTYLLQKLTMQKRCYNARQNYSRLGWPLVYGSHCSDVMEMKIMTGQVPCPVTYEDKCFLPFTEVKFSYTDGVEFCKSIGGHLANIYSQTHMDKIMNYTRNYRMSGHNRGLWLWLGMTYSATQGGEPMFYLHNGTMAKANLSRPSGNNTIGSGNKTKMILRVKADKNANNQYLVNVNSSHTCKVLCEIKKK